MSNAIAHQSYATMLGPTTGGKVRFEPGQSREVRLIAYGGDRRVFGFNQQIMGAL